MGEKQIEEFKQSRKQRWNVVEFSDFEMLLLYHLYNQEHKAPTIPDQINSKTFCPTCGAECKVNAEHKYVSIPADLKQRCDKECKDYPDCKCFNPFPADLQKELEYKIGQMNNVEFSGEGVPLFSFEQMIQIANSETSKKLHQQNMISVDEIQTAIEIARNSDLPTDTIIYAILNP